MNPQVKYDSGNRMTKGRSPPVTGTGPHLR